MLHFKNDLNEEWYIKFNKGTILLFFIIVWLNGENINEDESL